MNPAIRSHRSVARRRRRTRAFTIVEVMFAAIVMAFAVTSSITVLVHGMRAVDNARYTTLAGQILQSQIEKLRLLNWNQFIDATSGPMAPGNDTFAPDLAGTSTAQLQRFTAGGVANRCSQTITDASELAGGTMKKITLTATWKGSDGRTHSLSYITYYGRYGMSDFFYPTHQS